MDQTPSALPKALDPVSGTGMTLTEAVSRARTSPYGNCGQTDDGVLAPDEGRHTPFRPDGGPSDHGVGKVTVAWL